MTFGLFAEFVPTQSRGTQLTVLEGVFWTLGTLTECLVAMAVLKTHGWRWFLVASAAPSLLLAVLLVWDMFWEVLPESPRYLAIAGRADEALHILRGAAVLNGKPLPDQFKLVVDEQIEEMDRGSIARLFATTEITVMTLSLW